MITPHWFQKAAIDAIYSYFASGKRGNPLIGLPTGTGKSVVNALFVKGVLESYPNQRVLMLTHVKKLIKQNADRMLDVWPNAPLGIHSAGLKQRDTAHPIIFGGVASVYKNAAKLGRIDILIIDEAHLLGPDADSMYGQTIAALKAINPHLVVIGMSATLYRMGQGMLTEPGGLFTDVVFDMTDIAGFNRLIAEGFMCPLYPRRTTVELDVSSVGMSKGDFSKGDLEKAVDIKPLTHRILEELVYEGATRDHWMIFASGIDHCEHIAEILNDAFRIPTVAVHSKVPSEELDRRIERFESGEARCVVNNNLLTTGYDFPPIDLIGHLRPTMSPGLWVQMNGRGTRVSRQTNKVDCIALDFAGNTKRLGPINDPVKPRRKGEATGDAPVRICPECGTYCPASARQCYCCGHEFTFQEKLQQTASTAELIRSDAPIIETFKVARVIYHRHVSKKRPDAKPCIRVQYITGGLRAFDDWWHLDAQGRAGHEARDKWRQRAGIEPPRPETCAPYPSATDAALSIISQLLTPRAIRVWVNRPNPEIQSVEF